MKRIKQGLRTNSAEFRSSELYRAISLIVDSVEELNVTQHKPVQSIPYQCCPVCRGEGVVYTPRSASASYANCDVCNGQKIIPQAIIETHESISTI